MTWKTDYVAGAPRLAYDHLGEGDVVVFMHGIGGNRSNWHGQLPAFAAGYHAVAWDARGYGLSDDYSGPLDFADFSADLLRLLDHLGAGQAHLVGLSMGGRIAQDFYESHPQRVKTLVLCDTVPSFSQGLNQAQVEEFIRLRQQPLLAGKEPKDIAPVVAKTLVGRAATDEHFQRLVDSMSALHKASYIKTVEGMMRYAPVADLARFRVPVLLVFGEDDTLTPPAAGRRMQVALPDAELVVLERAGHLCNIELPDDFNAAVLDFLRRRG